MVADVCDAAASSALKATPPHAFLETQIQRLLTQIHARPPHQTSGPGEPPIVLSCSSEKTDWLAAIYSKNLVEASYVTEAMADKLMLYTLVKTFLGTETDTFLIKTMGLKQFLESQKLVDSNGLITADGEQIEAALYKEFPSGFIVRPAVGLVSTETEMGLFRDSDQFILALLKPGNSLYQPETFLHPIRSHILDAISSGEAAVLQDNVLRLADAAKLLKRHHAFKVRIHTYEGHVVPHSSPKRWVREDIEESSLLYQEAEKFVQSFLDRLPKEFLIRQAWSIEVSGFDNGVLRITDILTNRGKKISWSSYLDQSRVLEAYTNDFESNLNVEFSGLSGWLLRHGWGNYFNYWKLRISKAHGWHKVSACFPPLP